MSVFIGYPSFMAYQMMKGKKGNNDGFPSIPGMIDCKIFSIRSY